VSRKNYILIAKVIAALPNKVQAAEAFATALAAENSSFNKALFLKACGV